MSEPSLCAPKLSNVSCIGSKALLKLCSCCDLNAAEMAAAQNVDDNGQRQTTVVMSVEPGHGSSLTCQCHCHETKGGSLMGRHGRPEPGCCS